MDHKHCFINYKIQEYIESHSLRLNEFQRRLIAVNYRNKWSASMGSLCVAQHFEFILKTMHASRCLEIGCGVGYTALTMAMSLPSNGEVVTLDIESTEDQARQIWRESGHGHKIKLVIGEALNSLDTLVELGGPEQFDFAFIDGDKENYIEYYERCFLLVKKGGVIAIDNTLWSGKVLDPNNQDRRTASISQLNEKIKNDQRVGVTMLPIGDGLTLCYKK